MPGFLSKEELKYAYEEAELFAYPSKYEGFGLPPLEAMACGTPVLASNTTVFPETLGDAAELVNPYDIEAIASGMNRILTDNQLAERLTQRGRNRAEQFRWSRTKRQVYEAIRESVNESVSQDLPN